MALRHSLVATASLNSTVTNRLPVAVVTEGSPSVTTATGFRATRSATQPRPSQPATEFTVNDPAGDKMARTRATITTDPIASASRKPVISTPHIRSGNAPAPCAVPAAGAMRVGMLSSRPHRRGWVGCSGCLPETLLKPGIAAGRRWSARRLPRHPVGFLPRGAAAASRPTVLPLIIFSILPVIRQTQPIRTGVRPSP